MTSERTKPPIFIVGCGRSGTTLLRLMIDSHPNISCGPETRFLPQLEALYLQLTRLSGYGYEDQYWIDKASKFFDSFHSDYMKRRGKIRWADKSPSYVRQLDFVRTLFPDCMIIHIIRDARDVVASHKERWGFKSGFRSIHLWNRAVTAARAFGKRHPDQYFEVRYEDLVTDMEPTMRALLAFLEEPWDPIVLDYSKADHDVDGRHNALTEKRRAEGGDSSTVYSSRVGAGRKKLDPFLKTTCYVVNRKLMENLGYH